MDVVILAGGLGSRFGGFKQIESVDNDGNFLLDYSIYDSIRAGFDRVILIVKSDLLFFFKKRVSKWANYNIKIEIVVQTDCNQYTKSFNFIRKKPLGTAHAILCCKEVIDDNFCIINADDFYGKESFKKAYFFLKNKEKTSNTFGLIGYKLKNTLSALGPVKRGVCSVVNNYVKSIKECSIQYKNYSMDAIDIQDGNSLKIKGDEVVSMNMFCLTPNIFPFLATDFDEFVKDEDNLLRKEFLLPTEIIKYVSQEKASLQLIGTNEKWLGMTYREDRDMVVKGIADLRIKKIYPDKF